MTTRLLDIGVSGLRASQLGLTTAGHNIANANVEGYSRQEVSFAARDPQRINDVFVGSGVTVDDIRRVTDQFLVAQSFTDTSRFNELETLGASIEQLDKLLADEATGLSGVLSNLFNSLQAVSESPSSLALRQQLLSDAGRFVARYQSLDTSIAELERSADDIVEAQVNQINNLAASIAALNDQIAIDQTPDIGEPNDLLDRREQLLRDLSQYVGFRSVEDDRGNINVFIGGGQALVVGTRSNALRVERQGAGGGSLEIALVEVGEVKPITSQLNGGQLGGVIQFRSRGLGETRNQLGLLQTQLSFTFNQLHRQGVDLDGLAGGDFFTPINDPASQQVRVEAAVGNPQTGAILTASIDNPALLTSEEFVFRINEIGGFLNYELVRADDESLVRSGVLTPTVPQTISFAEQGFTLNLEQGVFVADQSFTIRPARLAATSVNLEVTDPANLALGLPVRTQSAVGNLGNAQIQQVDGSTVSIDPATAEQAMALRNQSPPLIIRFTSRSTYDILDGSDPVQPVDFNPPLRNFSYVPGQSNVVLDFDVGTHIYTTVGAFAFGAAPGAIGTTNNGNGGETITVNTVDPVTSVPTIQSATILANESAATAAARVNALEGVTATANTAVTFSVNDDGVGPAFEMRLNGIELTAASAGPVPNPVTADFIAERINSLLGSAGIVATVSGSDVNLRSLSGEDLTLENFGGGADTVDISAVNGSTLGSVVAVSGGNEVTLAGTLEVITDGNVSLSSSGGFLGGAVEQAVTAFPGYPIVISGVPEATDEFLILSNSTGAGDNRNALALAALQSADVLVNGSSLNDIYASLVSEVGSQAAAARVDREAAEVILEQTRARLDSVAGVNLDEEAAKLLEFEQLYSASARVISIARNIFDTLLGAF